MYVFCTVSDHIAYFGILQEFSSVFCGGMMH